MEWVNVLIFSIGFSDFAFRTDLLNNNLSTSMTTSLVFIYLFFNKTLFFFFEDIYFNKLLYCFYFDFNHLFYIGSVYIFYEF
jgi:hypothetical protein